MQPGKLYGPNPHGAGNYGGAEQTHKTACRHSNNPFGHSKECECGWWERERTEVVERASQQVPYYPPSPHEHPLDSCGSDCPECMERGWWSDLRAEKAKDRNK